MDRTLLMLQIANEDAFIAVSNDKGKTFKPHELKHCKFQTVLTNIDE